MKWIIALNLLKLQLIFAFNVSPNPNLVFQNPHKGSRPSYFGFSLNLRKTHILIGAPRANSTLSTQKNVVEPGMIYRCTYDENCNAFILDTATGSVYNESDANNLRANQFLGFSMDGHETENDTFVACVPKRVSYRANEISMVGVCYFTNDTKDLAPKNIFKVLTWKNINAQTAENGFSVHVPDDKNEFITGCPNWGSVKTPELGSLIKYDFNLVKNSTKDNPYQGVVADIPTIANTSYFGYAVTSGKFLLPNDLKLFYAVSAPRADNNSYVMIFPGIVPNLMENSLKLIEEQQFSYFGYAIVCDDFNNDGRPDLAVSAPFYSENNSFENGAVYVYLNNATDVRNLSLH